MFLIGLGVLEMDKRGQFFGLYIAFITLFFSFMVVGLYYYQDGETESSLVSSRVILEIEDNMEVFEESEVELILSSLESASGEFGTSEFIDSFRANFFSGFDSSMGEFIFSDLMLNGREIEDEARGLQDEFLENTLYPISLSYFNEEEFNFGRAEVGKKFVLRAEETTKINFPIDFTFEFSKEYLISRVGDKYVVGVK